MQAVVVFPPKEEEFISKVFQLPDQYQFFPDSETEAWANAHFVFKKGDGKLVHIRLDRGRIDYKEINPKDEPLLEQILRQVTRVYFNKPLSTAYAGRTMEVNLFNDKNIQLVGVGPSSKTWRTKNQNIFGVYQVHGGQILYNQDNPALEIQAEYKKGSGNTEILTQTSIHGVFNPKFIAEMYYPAWTAEEEIKQAQAFEAMQKDLANLAHTVFWGTSIEFSEMQVSSDGQQITFSNTQARQAGDTPFTLTLTKRGNEFVEFTLTVTPGSPAER